MLATLLSLSLVATPVAQDLANATRQLESARTTKESTEALEAEVENLTDAWVREETGLTAGLPLETRVARYYRLVALSTAGHADLRLFVENEARPTLTEWLNQGDALLRANKAVRVLALRKQFVAAVGKTSSLASIRADLDVAARQMLKADDDPFAQHVMRTAGALVDGAPMSMPAALTRLRLPRTPATLESRCAVEPPGFSFRSDGVDATVKISIGACEVVSSERNVNRELPYEGTVMVERQVQVITGTTTETYQVNEPCGQTCSTSNYDSTQNQVTCTPKFCESTRVRDVPVYETRTVLEPEKATLFESYVETLRTLEVHPTVSIVIEGDGVRFDKQWAVQAVLTESRFSTVHGGSASFSPNASQTLLQQLHTKLEAELAPQLEEWNRRRGEALLARATSLSDLMKAAVLTRTVSAPLATRVEADIGLLPSEAAALIEPHQASLVMPTFSVGASGGIVLPPPDQELSRRLATYENKVETVYNQGGYFGGLELGVAGLESNERNGAMRYGFGASATFAIMPPFTVKIPLFLRLVANPSGSVVGHVHFSALLRGEVGVRVRNFVVAAVAAGQFQWTLFTSANRSAATFEADSHFSTPLSVAWGYGAFVRLPFSFMSFNSSSDESDSFTVTPGIDLLAIRLHQSDPTVPMGVRAEARLFFDFGTIARVTASLMVNSQDDVPRFFSGRYHQFIGAVGLHSDF